MRKTISCFAAASCMLLSGSLESRAQLKILENGHVNIGVSSSIPGATSNIPNDYRSSLADESRGQLPIIDPGDFSYPLDSLSVVKILGDQLTGRIGFGTNGETWIGRFGNATSLGNGLDFQGAGGFRIQSGTVPLVKYTTTADTKTNPTRTKIYFTPGISAPAYLTSSDARLKSDIREIETPLQKLSGLHPVSYRLGKEESKRGAADANFQYGFLAQEARKVFPELVYEDEEGTLSMDYQSLIAVMAGCIRDLEATVEAQQQAMEVLEGKMFELTKGLEEREGKEEDCLLGQNTPNPFNVTTVIPCRVPETCANAAIGIYDLTGSRKLSLKVTGRGETSVTVDANSLHPGMYIYALIVDGMEMDSKRMIVTD